MEELFQRRIKLFRRLMELFSRRAKLFSCNMELFRKSSFVKCWSSLVEEQSSL
jgi:hypothetical protein